MLLRRVIAYATVLLAALGGTVSHAGIGYATDTPPPPPTGTPTIGPAITTPATSTSPTATPTTLLSTTTSTSTGPLVPAAAWARFDELLWSRLSRGDRAASVAVSVDGQIIHTAAFGARTTDDIPDPVTTDDRFRIASISKVVTAIVVLRLIDAGDLRLDQPVGQNLATLAGVPVGDSAMASVTVRQLLSHTSGFADFREQFFGGRFTSCREAAAYGLSRPLLHHPGTTHDYSNLNYCLLGLLVEHVTGLPYEEAAEQLLLRPLGIGGMRLVATFDPDPEEVVHVSSQGRTYMESLGGAGGWVATPADLVKILDSLDPSTQGWHPLPAELAALMPVALDVTYPEPNERRYGLGIVVWPDGSWGHTGTVENTHTMLVHRPDGVTWCVLVSGDTPESTESLREIFDDAVAGAGIALA